MTATLWGSPALLAEQALNSQHHLPPMVSHVLVDKSMIANAREKASGTGSRVNKDPESLLRLALPIKNKEVRAKKLCVCLCLCFVWSTQRLRTKMIRLSNSNYFCQCLRFVTCKKF
jgi:hypothetical protein